MCVRERERGGSNSKTEERNGRERIKVGLMERAQRGN